MRYPVQAIFFIAIFLITTFVYAQKQEVKFIDERHREVSQEAAHFYELIQIEADGSAEISRYTMDSARVSVAHYIDFEKNRDWIWIKHGPAKGWHSNGQQASEENYIKNEPEGTFISWFENGQVQYKSFYRNGELQDTLWGFYKSGEVRRMEVYAAGKMLKGEVYAQDGVVQPFYPYQEYPQFPKGEQAMLRFLGNNIKYPKSARKAKVSGLVVISFVVGENGIIKDAEVVKSLHPDTDAEAMRIVNAMPQWQPGRLEGEPVAVRYTLPVRFSVH